MASASQRLAFQCPVSVLRADLERLSPVPQPLEVKIDTMKLENCVEEHPVNKIKLGLGWILV